MTRRSAAAGFAAAVVAGLALLAVAATRPSLLVRDTTLDASSAVDAVLLTAKCIATVGVWAEARGIIPPRSWFTHPVAAAVAILTHITGRSR